MKCDCKKCKFEPEWNNADDGKDGTCQVTKEFVWLSEKDNKPRMYRHGQWIDTECEHYENGDFLK